MLKFIWTQKDAPEIDITNVLEHYKNSDAVNPIYTIENADLSMEL